MVRNDNRLRIMKDIIVKIVRFDNDLNVDDVDDVSGDNR